VRIKESNLVPLFGEGSFLREQAVNAVPLMSRLAAETGNGYWQWYVEQMGGPVEEPGYIGFAYPLPRNVKAVEPDDLPTSRLFRGTGLACLNTTLRDAREDVQVLFKASQMGTQSHGIESSNSFALWAYGERLLIRTGHYYMYGAPHHADWVWETKSQNNITVNGHGQVKHSPFSKGKIAAFKTAPRIDAVVGEAGEAYRIGGGGRRAPSARPFHPRHPLRQAGIDHRVRPPGGARALDLCLSPACPEPVPDGRTAEDPLRERRCEL